MIVFIDVSETSVINYAKELWKRKIAKSADTLERSIFVVKSGTYRGEFWVYMQKDENNIYCLSLPDNKYIEVPLDKWETGITNKIVEHLEKIPYNVYDICRAQYNEAKAKNNINRLKQPTPPSSVDRGKRKN